MTHLTNFPLPPPDLAQVWLDFDGTISRVDVLDELINRYAVNESWRLIEERWQAGLIGSRECLRQEFSLVRISARELEAFVDRIEVDPGLELLLEYLAQHRVPVTILSDGIERFIKRILARRGISRLEVYANRIVQCGERLRLICPHSHTHCQAGAAHCKCASAEQLRKPGRQTIYIGDGRSDLCPARKADRVFAKGVLARALAVEHLAYIPFVSLRDVASALRQAWSTRAAVI